MQYTVKLPASFDGAKVAERVKSRDHLFRGLPGLIHKSYLYNEDDRLYAPIYVWATHEAARQFLFGELFDSVAKKFGRPRVRLWHVIAFGHGGTGARPGHACYELDPVGQEERLESVMKRELDGHSTALAAPGLYARITAVDTDRWELARFSLWENETMVPKCGADCIQGYRVVAICEPAQSKPKQSE